VRNSLSLQEQLLLLCLDDQSGAFRVSWIDHGLSGGALAELMLRERIHLDERNRVVVENPAPTGDDLLDRALSRLAEGRRPGRLSGWAATLYKGRPTVRDSLLARLVDRGILTPQEGRILWLFRHIRYPAADPSPELALRDRLREVLLGDVPVEQRLAILIGLLHGLRALGQLLTKVELKQQRQRVQQICDGDPISRVIAKAVWDAVSAAQAAASGGG